MAILRFKTLPLLVFILLSATLAPAASPAPGTGPLSVFVSILPQKFFVERIGQDRVAVQVMVTPGASPATYEPKPRQMAALADAHAYFAVGVPFERVWLEKIAAANPKMTLVHTDDEIHKRSMAAHHHDGDHHDAPEADHAPHGEGAHHMEGAPDPHIWLSPPLVKKQAHRILTALKALDPAHGADFEANYQRFITAVDTLDQDLRATFADHHGLEFMVFHPSWGYFADAYGLTQVPIELEGKNPKPAQVQSLIEHARERGIKVIFVQPQFSTKSARLIAREIGGRVAVADPLAEAWLANLRAVAAQFRAALK
jgi:zinc transport system substrate-binding protein